MTILQQNALIFFDLMFKLLFTCFELYSFKLQKSVPYEENNHLLNSCSKYPLSDRLFKGVDAL